MLLTRTLGTVTAASLVLMVFGLLNTKYGFLEGFQKTFQFAALLAFAAAGSSALITLGGPTPSSVSGEMHEEKHVTPVYMEKV